MQLSIKDLNLSLLYMEQINKQYEIIFSSQETINEFIFSYLTSKPGFIQHGENKYDKSASDDEYKNRLLSVVRKGQPIQVFLTAYRPKYKNLEVSGGFYLPDMGEFISFIHLSLIANNIKKIYSPGLRFIIAYEGAFLADLSKHSLEEVEKTENHLLWLMKTAEQVIGGPLPIQLINLKTAVQNIGPDYEKNYRENLKIVLDKIEQNDNYRKATYELANYLYDRVIHILDFKSIEDAKNHCLDQAVFLRTHKGVQYKGGEKNTGILNAFPHAVRASIRRNTTNTLNFQLVPGFNDYTCSGITVLDAQKKWTLRDYRYIVEHKLTPVYLENLPDPFYYIEK
jgi:pyoverdine/dityrosine biosynthesis protein Dit1